ncbi:MAG: hypothetical protein EOO61_05100 [Hymenobacter sp.]|nr:MAG: hypothetical protein EOO61_05100 [Hymenobacter sp.]
MYHLKFYADCPDNGPANKLFCYPVHDGKHACDLLARFVAKSYRLRAAFMGLPGAKGQTLPSAAVKFPASVASASSLLVKYPPLTNAAAPTSKELDALAAQYPELRAALTKLRTAA